MTFLRYMTRIVVVYSGVLPPVLLMTIPIMERCGYIHGAETICELIKPGDPFEEEY